MALPNTLIIGAQKGGSTWLYDVLRDHPEVYLPKKVELLHFSKNNCSEPSIVESYIKHFDKALPSHKVIAEKTPAYLWTYNEQTNDDYFSGTHNKTLISDVEKQLGNDVKIIISLRHPVTRLISAFFHHASRERIPLNSSFTESQKKFGMLDIGFYSRHVKEWLKVYPKEQVLTLIMERDIIKSPNSGKNKLTNFLDISKFDSSIKKDKKSNKGISKVWKKEGIFSSLENSPFITNEEILWLLNIYKKDMDELRLLLNDELNEWRAVDEALTDYCKAYTSINESFKQLDKNEFIYGVDSVHNLMSEVGIDLSVRSAKMSSNQVLIEPPAKLSNVIAMYHSEVGAFTYFTSGYIYNTKVGRYCSIARDVNIGQNNHPMDWLSTNPFQYEANLKFRSGNLYQHREKYIKSKIPAANREKVLDNIRKPKTIIGNDVWIGHGVIIVAGVNIGNGAIIGAGSVVTKDVPDYAIVAGAPAKIIRYRFSDEMIKKLLKSKWWQYSTWSLSMVNFSDIDKALSQISEMKASMTIMPYVTEIIEFQSIRDLFNKSTK